jgi:putative ABC transport system substrate-binding protein
VAGGGVGAEPALPVIGYLSIGSADDEYKNLIVPFLQGLKETGYVEGQNVAVEYRWAENCTSTVKGKTEETEGGGALVAYGRPPFAWVQRATDALRYRLPRESTRRGRVRGLGQSI